MEGVLTQFKRPASGGVVGLLAHNFASGKWFEKFEVGDVFYRDLRGWRDKEVPVIRKGEIPRRKREEHAD